jgi:hypothetical protein
MHMYVCGQQCIVADSRKMITANLSTRNEGGEERKEMEEFKAIDIVFNFPTLSLSLSLSRSVTRYSAGMIHQLRQ